jgi:predicted nucleic acid-binding protein
MPWRPARCCTRGRAGWTRLFSSHSNVRLRAAKTVRAQFLPSLRGRQLVISIVSVEEVLEGAADAAAAFASLQRFAIQGSHVAQARRCALLRRRASRRMGENDAWLVAAAESINADVVGADRAAFERLGARYLRFR